MYPELAPLLMDPELDSAYKEFLIAYQERGKEGAIELARRRGLLTREDEVRLTLILDGPYSVPLAEQLESAGVRVIAAYQDRIDIAIPLALIEQETQSEEPGRIFRQLSGLEHVIAVRVPVLHTPQGSQIPGEGIRVIGAEAWHRAGFTGAGMRIGILDMGFGGYQDLLGKELPDQVTVATFGDWDPEEVHGTACAEIIHEIAPDAQLFFAWYDGSEAAEGEAVDWLLSQGVHIISHSAGGLVGPRDGSGWQAQLVDSVAARGVLWVNSSGNEADSHYRGVFTDQDGDGIHEFAPGREVMPVYPYSSIVEVALMWDDVWGGASQDYELYIVDRQGNPLGASENIQDGGFGQEPFEMIIYRWGGEDLFVLVMVYAADRAATLDIFVLGADVAYPSPEYSLVVPADAVGALAVGAVEWQRDTLAEYSSRGPTTDGRLKPEISAPTGVSCAAYGEPFGGTSASAPHVVGAAALVWQAYPEFTRQQVVDFLLTHAVDRGPRGPDTGYGYGRLQLPSPPSPAAAPSPVPTPEVSQAPPEPLPTPTPVVYGTPGPSPSAAGLISPSIWMLVIGAMGCTGILLVVGATIATVLNRHATTPPPPSPGMGPIPPSVLYPPPSYGPPLSPTPPVPTLPVSPPTTLETCPYCGALLRPGARFCPRCGYSLHSAAALCPYCGALLRPGARFCSRCGHSLHSAAALCPYCGALLRPGARFCPRCGRAIGEK